MFGRVIKYSKWFQDVESDLYVSGLPENDNGGGHLDTYL